jgi:hypothetical protein
MRLPALGADAFEVVVGVLAARLPCGLAAIARRAAWRRLARVGVIETDGGLGQWADRTVATTLTRVAYELLDAHADTADLVAELPYDPHWAAHLAYLTALQRKGRETLAHSSLEVPA